MAQFEDLLVDQGSDVEIKLELHNPDGSIKILNKYVQATNSIVPLFSAEAKIKKSFNDSAAFGRNFPITIERGNIRKIKYFGDLRLIKNNRIFE